MAEYMSNSTTNSENLLHFREVVEDDPFIAVYLLVTICLCMMGTCGNTLVLLTVIMNKKLHTVSNIFIVNLAVADIGVTSLVDAFTIVGIITSRQFLPPQTTLCAFVGSFCLICCSCSLWNIMAVGINRYIYICKSHLYRKIYTVPTTLAMAAAVWLSCFLLDFPNFVGWGDHGYDAKTMVCSYSRTASLSWLLFFVISAVLVPACIILYCYISVYLLVRNHGLTFTGGFQRNTVRLKKKDIQLMKTLFAIFLVFITCWVPYAIVVVADVNDTWPHYIHITVWIMAHGNSALDSILYGVMNKQFRDGYAVIISYIFCCCREAILKSNRVGTTTVSVLSMPTKPESKATPRPIKLAGVEEVSL
ncbi:melatonin receptor type 1B-B-like [Saccoglossus kowalevskii]|uniref:Melatonin receptor type 1B-B-like n=1 Tax=Saccoglossus kowalevskii TaxID=10224 RepID=A0ABM0GUK7_SACKO|nr:PREDICTED: melatonin receptor type 1B-B-like [Saccoglossus kowalevskii]